MSQPKYLTVPVSCLQPNPWNTNVVSPVNDLKLEESIRRNGLFKPIIVRELPVDEGSSPQQIYEIIGGEHRWRAAINIGMQQVPIVNLGDIDDKRAKEISVIDNARYGDDDTLAFAELMKELGSVEDLQSFLPYVDEDLSAIFSASNIALDALETSADLEKIAAGEEPDEPPAAKAPKTHTIMRFKVSNRDAERITALIAKTQKNQGFTLSDDLTNAGDALVFLLFAQSQSSVTDADDAQPTVALEDIDELIAEVSQ